MMGPVESADLVFVHLSDIHFRKGRVGDAHDEDMELRGELQRDLRTLQSHFSRFDGLLITGDIAFSGKREEFDYAASWIETIREQLDIDPRKGIMVIPGNHDIDRDALAVGSDAIALHQRIRGQGAGCDGALTTVLRNAADGDSLLLPMAAYNDFARRYGCDITCAQPFWERDFALGDGSIFRIRGVTTTLISGPDDDENTSRMLYGAAQRMLRREDNVRRAVIGHHPPTWAIDRDDIDASYSVLTSFQAFGHKHDQWLTPIGQSVRLISGAMHPDRREPQWEPRYCAIAVSAVDEEHLSVRVYPRRWSREERMFIADINSNYQDFRKHDVRVTSRVQVANRAGA